MTDCLPISVSQLMLLRDAKVVLHGLDWDVPAGTATGLLGRNGAGKSTLIHTLLGLVPQAVGECKTLGQNATQLDDARLSRIGFVDQHFGLLNWLRVEDQVHYVALMRPTWDHALERELLDAFELRASAHLRVSALSAGARQRLAVLVALCHHPELILLDEPVSAQDPIFRDIVLKAIRTRVIEDGATVVLSSHVLRDIESVVDRISMLDGGRITVNEDLDTLKEEHQLWTAVGGQLTVDEAAALHYVLHAEKAGGALRMYVRANEKQRREFAAAHGCTVEVRGLGLEGLFPLLLGANPTGGSQ